MNFRTFGEPRFHTKSDLEDLAGCALRAITWESWNQGDPRRPPKPVHPAGTKIAEPVIPQLLNRLVDVKMYVSITFT